jgi:hypothetical protein
MRRILGLTLALYSLSLSPGFAAPLSITITGPGETAAVTPAQIDALPQVIVRTSFLTDHGPLKATFTGPLLWTVLTTTHALAPHAHMDVVRQAIILRGADGYTALIAMAEISPAFENKPVILADSMNGQPLPPGHPRIIVPSDARGGRAVRDLTQITILTEPDDKS